MSPPPPKTERTPWEGMLKALAEVLSEKEKELDKREEELRKEQERFEIEKASEYDGVCSSDVIHLNVGGRKISTLRRTLTLVPGSMLASKFSGRWDDSMEKDENGHFFIDEDYELFAPMLSFLRKKIKGDVKYCAEPPHRNANFGNGLYIEDFYRMIEYYGVRDVLYATSLKVIHTSSDDDNTCTVVTITDLQVRATEWSTVELVAIGHRRRVCTFEVTLGDVERFQIGWKYEEKFDAQNNIRKSQGVGEHKKSSALDLDGSSLIAYGRTTAVTELTHKKGTVVRTENFGKNWYVNGEPIDTGSVNSYVGYFKCISEYPSDNGTVYPAISLQGDAEVTCVEFEN